LSKGLKQLVVGLLAMMTASAAAASIRLPDNNTSETPASYQDSVAPRGDVDPEAQKLWLLAQYTQSQTVDRLQTSQSLEVADRILTQTCEGKSIEQMRADILRAEADNMDSRNGLELRGGYSSESFNNDDNEPRAYLELSWDVLRNGYRANGHRSQALYGEAELVELRGSKKQLVESYRCRRYRLAQTFSGLYGYILSLKLELMKPVYDVERRAYFKGWSYLDDYLVSEGDIRELESELRYISMDDEQTDKGFIRIPPIIDVRIQDVIEEIRNDDHNARLAALQKKVLSEKERARERNRLRFFVRKTFDIENTGGNDGMVAGLRFNVPLERQKHDILKYKMEQVDQEVELHSWERISRARAAYAELREQMRRVIKQRYRYLRTQERVRRIFIEKKIAGDEVELARVIARVRSLMETGIELVRAREELYRRVNQVFLAAQIEYHPSMLQRVNMNQDINRARTGERSVYLWSGMFNKTPNAVIQDFLEAKSARTVLLSAGRKTDRVKLMEYIRTANRHQQKVELIVGDNNWIEPGKYERAAATVATVSEITGAIHLDIEPHTLAGYKTDREQTMTHYLEMLRRLREAASINKLTVAVPLHWKEDEYRIVGELADSVYFMTYGSTDIKKLARRLAKVVDYVAPEKVIVVLRIDDFEDEWALEQAFDYLRSKMGIRRFGIHQFRKYFSQSGEQL